MKEPSLADRLRIEGDNYNQTVLALRAFANEILFDDESRRPVSDGSAHCGRRLRTSPRNRRAPGTDVQPDLVVVRTTPYRVIAEAKFGFGPDPGVFARRIEETVEQIEKYDDTLTGWPSLGKRCGPTTEPAHDLVILLNFEDARRVCRELAARRKRGEFILERSLAILSIARLGRAEGQWPVITLEDGSLSNPQKTAKFEDRLPIRPGVLARNPHIGLVKFYDHAPPLPLMMQFVHEALVGQLSQDEQQQYNLDGKVDKPFILSDLCSWLSNHALRRADNRDALVPQAKWVELALARLVRIDWVSRDPAKHGAFVYHHRKGRKGANDPYGRFIDVCAKELSREQDKARRAEQKAVARMQASDEKFRKEHPLLADLPAPPQREGS